MSHDPLPTTAASLLSRLRASYHRHQARRTFRREARRGLWFLGHVGVGR